MCSINLESYKKVNEFYKDKLINDITKFWLNHALDGEYGGYFSYLNQDGSRYGNNKFMWPQGRGAYQFAKLFNVLGKRQEWLDAAEIGIHFIDKYAFDAEGWAYYKVMRDGTPLFGKNDQPYTELFIALAYSEYAKASKKQEYYDKALNIFKAQVKKIESGYFASSSNVRTVLYKEHAMPMIALNVAQEMRDVQSNSFLDEVIEKWVFEEMYLFANDEYRVLFERVGLDGEPYLDEPEGRTITPGHAMESAWFCLREGMIKHNESLINRASEVVDWTMEKGWDHEYGGLFNFLDVRGFPPGHHDEGWGEDQDWDEKIFWVHAEALSAIAYAFYGTGDKKFLEHFNKLHSWTFNHFPDEKHGEWFGYLRRDGSLSQSLKGSVKGFFHIPRAFLQIVLLTERKLKGTL